MKMTVVDGYRLVSNSEVQNFKQCRRKWWLAWHRGLTPQRVEFTGVRSIGTRNHLALSMYYTPGYVGSVHPVVAHEQIAAQELARFDAQPYTNPDTRSTLVKNLTLESIMLAGYMQWVVETGADADLEIISSETFLSHEIRSGVKIIGKVDLRTRDRYTGRRRFMDHKNVQVFVDPQTLRQNEQFLHYELLEALSGETERCEGGIYNQLRRSKRTARAQPPFYHRESVTHNSYDLASYQARLLGVIAEIERAQDALDSGVSHQSVAYPSPRPSCAWQCMFARICPLFDDGSRVEDAIAAQFVTSNPLDYYGGSEREDEV